MHSESRQVFVSVHQNQNVGVFIYLHLVLLIAPDTENVWCDFCVFSEGGRCMILEEFEKEQEAVINPWNIIKPIKGIPKVAICCQSHITFERIISELGAEIIAQTSSANGIKPIYQAKYKNTNVALFMIDVGAPMSVGMLEDVYQMGVEKIIVFGTCGVLDSKIEDCSIIIPDKAVRDEGTSYHYVKAADEIRVNEKYMGILTELLEEVIQFFYAADNLDSEEWDVRSLGNYDKLEEKDRIAAVALELALRINA